MGIQIADCSLRDGGYVGDKNFSKEFIDGVMSGLTRAGIDLIETGFLQINVTGDSLVYADSKDVKRNIPSKKYRSEFVGFCDNSRYDIEHLDPCTGDSFTTIKISFAKHEWEEALTFCSNAKKKGYKVFIQPMDAMSYSEEEREKMIKEVNEIMPDAFAIVDTFGVMHLSDLKMVFEQMNALLDKKIKIALHTHNNLCIANALVEELINLCMAANRDVVVDGSLLGMARGAGNSCTEAIASYVNERFGGQYDIGVLIETIEKYIVPVKKEKEWGYDIPMFICGMKGAHVDNIEHLKSSTNFDYADMYRVIGMLKPDQRKRYGKNYSKTDFSQLNNMIEEYKNGVE